jgi:hypothetical protein
MILIPKFSNTIEFGGTLAIAHFGPNGELIENRFYSNIVTTIGKNWIAARMKDTGLPTQMTHMAVGGATLASAVSKTTPVIGDQALSTGGSPSLSELARVALTTAGGTVSSAVVTYAATFAAGTGTGALIEAGIFNASSGPVQGSGTINAAMLCKTSFDVVNKAANDSIAITWTVTIQ